MDFKRIFKTPLFWVLAVIVVMLTVFSFDGNGGYTTVTTAQAEKLITDKKVETAVLTTDNVLNLDLKPGQTFSDSASDISGATKVQADYVDARAEQLITALKANVPNGYNDKKQGDSAFWTIFISFFPVLLLVGLFWFLMSQMQGGGSRVMQFGKSRAKLATKDTPKVTFADVAGADEAVEELHEIKEFLAGARQVPRGRRQDPQGRAALRPARHRQDPARPRRRRRGRACRSTRSPAPTSSRCSSASAPPACATCSSRPRPTPPPSSSSTRSTPSAGTVAPASAVATTSASRP